MSTNLNRILAGLLLLLLVGLAAHAKADAAAANACAAKLPKDAKAIYNATLPEVTPGANLRDLVIARTRSLAISGAIDRGTARASAKAAAGCLRQATP